MNHLSAHIVFKLASRERPQRFKDTLDNLYAMIADKERFTIWCVLDEDDPTHQEYREVLYATATPNLIVSWGTSKSKIDAINRPIPEEYEWDILVNISDDQRLTVFGFDVIVRSYFDEHFPNGDGYLHLQDIDADDRVPILYIADRTYFNRDGFIYNPVYFSLFADNESMHVARHRGRYVYIPGIIYHHLLPACGHLPEDEMFRRQQDIGWTVDQATFTEREKHNFYLT
jgi:hypothetical protein